MSLEDKIALLKKYVREYPNFPKEGILFRDLFSVFQEPNALGILRDVLVDSATNIQPPVECIVGLDARGFLLGPLIALQLNIPFVPVRKKGKLPGKCLKVTYGLEYGADTLEIQEESIKEGQKVLIVDDLIATGGSLKAACNLVEGLKGTVVACLVLMELTELQGRSFLPVDVVSILKY